MESGLEVGESLFHGVNEGSVALAGDDAHNVETLEGQAKAEEDLSDVVEESHIYMLLFLVSFDINF